MNEQEERYLHFAFSIESLNKAWRILNEVKHQEENSLAGYAFQFALIEYSKPYKTSFGIAIKQHKLSEAFTPIQYSELHKRILHARDKILAHTDFEIRDAKVHKHENFIGKSENLIYGTEEMKNIDQIIDLIEKTLDTMYEEFKKIGEDLPINYQKE